MDMSALSLMKDYGGLVIGLVLLIAAAWVIPGRAKWYVLTAGLAILGYEAYVRTTNRKLLAEADKERDALRKRTDALKQRSDDLQKTVTDLNRQLADNQTKLGALNREAAGLAQRGTDISARKAQLDAESKRRTQDNEKLLRQVAGHEALLATLQDAQHAVAQLDKTNQ